MPKIAVIEPSSVNFYIVPKDVTISDWVADNPTINLNNCVWSELHEPLPSKLEVLFKHRCIECNIVGLEEDTLSNVCPICGNGICQSCFENGNTIPSQEYNIKYTIDDPVLFERLKEKSNGKTEFICDSCIDKTIEEIKKDNK